MGIDLFTLIGQIFNLILLIWLLKKFLYQPILKMVDARQELILNSINEAKTAEAEALKQQELYTQKVEDFDQERFALLKEVAEDAEDLRKSLMKEIQQATQESKRNFQREMSLQKQSFELSAQNIIVENFRNLATKAFKEMADESLSERIIEQFKKKLSKMTPKAQKSLYQEIEQQGTISVLSGFKLKASESEDLKRFIRKMFNLSKGISFTFTQNHNLICGIEMQVGENVISWNLSKYLENFDVNMNEALNNLVQEE